jgi:hypothetical protein
MSLYTIEFEISTNADWEDYFELRDDAGPVDLTDFAFGMDVRGDNGELLLSASSEGETFVIVDAATGLFGIKVPASAMTDVPPGLYRCDCVMGDGNRLLNLWSGSVLVREGITQ